MLSFELEALFCMLMETSQNHLGFEEKVTTSWEEITVSHFCWDISSVTSVWVPSSSTGVFFLFVWVVFILLKPVCTTPNDICGI